MDDPDLNLLRQLADTADGVRYQACDGLRRKAAWDLEQAGLATWKGSSFGSQFFCITDAGRTILNQDSPNAR